LSRPYASDAHSVQQLEALIAHFISKERFEAANNLVAAVDAAARRIEADPRRGLPAPRPYPDLARFGFLWIKEYRYWFGWSIAKGCIQC
jgi:hypothetical protein